MLALDQYHKQLSSTVMLIAHGNVRVRVRSRLAEVVGHPSQ